MKFNSLFYFLFVIYEYSSLNQGSALGSQSHGIPVPIPNFGIGIGIGIDFSEFWDWDWDWDRFFKILGLGLGLGSIFQKFGIGIGLGITNLGSNPKKSQESQEIPKVLGEGPFFVLKFLIGNLCSSALEAEIFYCYE